MAIPYCNSNDIFAINQKRPYDATSNPSLNEVKDWMFQAFARINIALRESGYSSPATPSVTTELSAAPASGAATISVDAVTSFEQGSVLRLISATALTDEFIRIKSIASLVVSVEPALGSAYAVDDDVWLMNNGLLVLRRINALGTAAVAEESGFMGLSPNRSQHALTLKEQFEIELVNIRTRPDYLYDLTTNNNAAQWPESSALSSLHEQYPVDSPETSDEIKSGVEPFIQMGMQF